MMWSGWLLSVPYRNLLSGQPLHHSKQSETGDMMKGSRLAEQLSNELGIIIEPSRISKYEDRGILTTPKRVGKYKNYTDQDYDKVKKIVVLSEFGIHLDDVRRYLLGMGKEELEHEFRDRIEKLEKIITVAKGIWSIR
jgi:DNA-binding transcriptional MerR regulator